MQGTINRSGDRMRRGEVSPCAAMCSLPSAGARIRSYPLAGAQPRTPSVGEPVPPHPLPGVAQLRPFPLSLRGMSRSDRGSCVSLRGRALSAFGQESLPRVTALGVESEQRILPPTHPQAMRKHCCRGGWGSWLPQRVWAAPTKSRRTTSFIMQG